MSKIWPFLLNKYMKNSCNLLFETLEKWFGQTDRNINKIERENIYDYLLRTEIQVTFRTNVAPMEKIMIISIYNWKWQLWRYYNSDSLSKPNVTRNYHTVVDLN